MPPPSAGAVPVTIDPHSGQEHPLAHPPGKWARSCGRPRLSTPAATRPARLRPCPGASRSRVQNAAPESFAGRNMASAQCHKVGGPIYCSPLACATCDSSAPRSSSSQRGGGGGCASSAAPRHPSISVPREPLRITIVLSRHRRADSGAGFSSVRQCRPGRAEVAFRSTDSPCECLRPAVGSRGCRCRAIRGAISDRGARRCPFRAAGNHVRRRIAQPSGHRGRHAWIDTTSFTANRHRSPSGGRAFAFPCARPLLRRCDCGWKEERRKCYSSGHASRRTRVGRRAFGTTLRRSACRGGRSLRRVAARRAAVWMRSSRSSSERIRLAPSGALVLDPLDPRAPGGWSC